MGLIYQHPGTFIPEFSKQFSEFLLENIVGYKEICIFGDISINTLNDKVTSVKITSIKFMALVLQIWLVFQLE